MAGYTRDDVTDQISNGNNIDATALDGEFDAIQGAFASSGGHTHDGTTGGGSPILATGPTQDIVASATSLTPKTDDAIDLGSATYEWRNLFIDGTANIDSLVADTADINAGTIDGVVIGASAAGAITGTTITGTSLVGPLTGNADTATVLATARTINGTSFNGSSAITTANWGTARTITVGGTGKSVDGSGAITWSLAEIGVGTLGQQASGAVTITGGTITGITDLTVADGGTGASTAAGARTNLGLVLGTDVQAYDTGLASIAGLTTAADRMIYTTASDVYATTTLTSAGRALIDDVNAAAQLVTLGLTATAAELNYVDGVTSNVQTQLDTKAPKASPVFTGAITEQVYALSGTTPALSPANGTIQTWTLTGDSTPTDSLTTGQSLMVMIDDGTGYTVTWPTIQWAGGVAPVLPTTGYCAITLWKVGSTLYGATAGNMS